MRAALSCPPPLNQPYPWLVIFDGANDSRQTFYSISQNRYYIRSVPEMHNKFIVSSQKGWLHLEDNETNDCFLFNMFTLEKLQLPPLYGFDGIYHTSVISSSCSKIDESCRILVQWGYTTKFRSCHLGDKEFVEQEVNICRVNIGAKVNYEGKLYALTMDYDLLVADFAEPNLHFTPVFPGHKSFYQMLIITNGTKLYLVESCGELLFVYTNRFDHDGLDIKIYKADFDMKEWVVVEDLGDRALFLDNYKGLSSSSTASEFGLRVNCVYYASARDRHVYVCDLEDETITMSLPCPIVSNKYSSLFWVM